MNNDPIEFAAEKLSVATQKSIIGLQRWKSDVMISFFPVNFEGERLKHDSGIDKVYDLFLTEEQMRCLIREYLNQTSAC